MSKAAGRPACIFKAPFAQTKLVRVCRALPKVAVTCAMVRRLSAGMSHRAQCENALQLPFRGLCAWLAASALPRVHTRSRACAWLPPRILWNDPFLGIFGRRGGQAVLSDAMPRCHSLDIETPFRCAPSAGGGGLRNASPLRARAMRSGAIFRFHRNGARIENTLTAPTPAWTRICRAGSRPHGL